MTNKDLDYVKDAFNWNLNAYKTVEGIICNITKNDLKNNLKTSLKVYYDNMNLLLKLLKEEING